jgi:hypothetical protein
MFNLKQYQREYRKRHVEKTRLYNKEYRQKNIEKAREYSRSYSLKNKETAKQRAMNWYYKNHKRSLAYWATKRVDPAYREKMRLYLKEYYRKNKERLLIKNKEYRSLPGHLKQKAKNHNRNMEENSNYIFAHILRSRILAAIKFRRGSKAYKSIDLLGCSIEEARQHIERQFKKGMCWSNHGMFTWHIDHIVPLIRFDLTKPEEQKKAFHFTNLQPLFANENLSKHSKHNDDIGRSI